MKYILLLTFTFLIIYGIINIFLNGEETFSGKKLAYLLIFTFVIINLIVYAFLYLSSYYNMELEFIEISLIASLMVVCTIIIVLAIKNKK